MANRWLATRNEEPIRPSQIAYCDVCRVEYVRTAADRRRGQVEKLRKLIIELKESRDANGERDLIKQIEAMHHPDVRGLLERIAAKKEAQPASKRARPSEVLR